MSSTTCPRGAALSLAGLLFATSGRPSIEIGLAQGSERERTTRAALEQVVASYDLGRYTFTRRVVIEEGAINHAFPVHYTWIYETVLRDEARIAAVVAAHHLEIR